MCVLAMSTLLEQPHLCVITRNADSVLARVRDVLEHPVPVDGRVELESLLARLLAEVIESGAAPIPKTLDLIGHSTTTAWLLQLGDWVIDAASPDVIEFFRELADDNVLPRLGVHAVRLLGCNTACTAPGRATIAMLAEVLGLEVYGTSGMIFSAHYAASGFDRDWRFLLVSSTDLRERDFAATAAAIAPRSPRVLDAGTLPAVTLDSCRPPWPRRLATVEEGHRLLRIIRCDQGAPMPGPPALPSCEVLWPAVTPNAYHLVQIVFDGAFVRAYPDGASQPGLLYPVAEPLALREIVETMPELDPSTAPDPSTIPDPPGLAVH